MRGASIVGLWAALMTSIVAVSATAQDAPAAQGSTEGSGAAPAVVGTRASVVGVALPDAGGPRLIVRHLTDDGLVRRPSATAFTVGAPPTPLEPRGDAVPLAASGVAFTIHLVLDDGPGDALPDALEATVLDDALVAGLRNTFNPGERVGVTVVGAAPSDTDGSGDASAASGGDGPGSGDASSPSSAAALAPGDDLAAVEAFVASSWTRTASASSMLEALSTALDAVPDDGAAHRELVVVSWWAPSTAPVADLVTRARDVGAPVSVALFTDTVPDGVDPLAHPLCDLARQTGGVCHAGPTAEAGRLIPRVLADAQLLYVTPVTCAEGIAGMDRVAVVATTAVAASDPFRVPGPRIACETWSTFDPSWDPIAEGSAEGSGDAEGSGEAASAMPFGLPPAAVYGAGGGVALIVLVVLVAATRRRRSRFDLDDDVYTRGGAPSHRISALDNLAPNSGAAVLEARGPVPDRPDWLRDPEVDPVRRMVRQWQSGTGDLHLVWSDGDGVRERALSEPVVLGHGPDCDVQIPGTSGAVVRIAPRGRQLDVQILDATTAVEHNGIRVTGQITAVAGSELTLGGHIVAELRSLSTDGSDPARSAANRAKRRRLVPQDERAFSAIDVGTTSVILGRDPLPYRGVQSVPAKLVIAQVSNDHAEVWVSGGHLFVRDLGSSNGTLVGGLRIDPHVATAVAEGQTIALSPLVVFTVR